MVPEENAEDATRQVDFITKQVREALHGSLIGECTDRGAIEGRIKDATVKLFLALRPDLTEADLPHFIVESSEDQVRIRAVDREAGENLSMFTWIKGGEE